MNFPSSPLALATALALASLAPSSAAVSSPAQGSQATAPPGTVLIPGGRTKIGNDPKAIERLLDQNPVLRGNRVALASETPQFTENVPSFYLMVNTVTNEQYKAFVEATGARPPHTWGAAAVEAGRAAFLEEDGRRRREAQLAKQPIPERQIFFPDLWWRRNWQNHEWQMPARLALEPVVYVDYQDAVAYARWAGMRLPTEFEYQRAIRGNTDRDYPWGSTWELGRAATKELGMSNPFPIASFPEGASEEGVFDLVGNVWQWTSSPFSPYPGYKDLQMTFGRGSRDRERVTVVARFDPNLRVTVGGSVQNEPFASRATTRRGTERTQSTHAMGFRCAASVEVGWDIAATILEERVPVAIRPTDVNGPVLYEPKQAVAMDRWIFRQGSNHTKSMALPEGSAKQTQDTGQPTLPPQYAVITGYKHVVFVPAGGLYATGPNDVRDASLTTGPVHFGILSTSLPVVEPALEAGTYLVAIRGAGERKEARPGRREEVPAGEGDEEGPAVPAAERPSIRELLPTIDIQVDNFIFYDMTGTPVTHHRIRGMDWGNITPSTTAITKRTRKETVDGKEVEIPETWYEQRLFLPGRGGRQGLKLTLPLRFEEGTLDADWRRPR